MSAFLSLGSGGRKAADLAAPESAFDMMYALADSAAGQVVKTEGDQVNHEAVAEESVSSSLNGASTAPMAPPVLPGEEAMPSEPLPDDWAETSDAEVLNAPPALTVMLGGDSVEALRGTSSWMYRNGDGTATGVESDSMHPLEAREYMEPLLIDSSNALTARLDWSVNPDAVTVCCWDEKSWGKTNAKGESVPVDVLEIDLVGGGWSTDYLLELKSGNYIYEVVAEWKSSSDFGGLARYSFYTLTDSGK